MKLRRLSLVALIVVLASLPLSAATFTVNDLGDAGDNNLGDGICATAGAVCTLRAAIEEANSSAGADVVQFSVAGTITPGTPYAGITEQLDLDATTAPGYAGLPLIDIDGAFSSTICFDFFAGAANSRVRGFKIHGFSSRAIRIASANAVIQANYIGPVGNGTPNLVGIELTFLSSAAQIGGAGGSDGNVISGNMSHGILMSGNDHEVRDNFVGTNAAGLAAQGNGGDGIHVSNGANNITIGAFFGGLENVISGNTGDGIEFDNASSNRVAGNYIGLDSTGLAALANGGNGVSITNGSSSNEVGNADTRCYISGNTGAGVLIDGTSSSNIVQACYIGVDTTGSAAVGNGIGVSDAGSSDTIGKPTAGNVISGNSAFGISLVSAQDTTIQANIIGLEAAGTAIVGNGDDGIHIVTSTNITIGGSNDVSEGNVISGNGDDGIDANGSTTLHIFNNIIGLRADQSDIAGNGFHGIRFSTTTGSEIGTTGAGNVSSGNSVDGILLETASDTNTITANFLGTNGTGTTDFGNLQSGLELDSSNNNTISSNVISGNDQEGVWIHGTSSGNTFTSNTIGRNATNTAALPNGAQGGVLIADGAIDNIIGAIGSGNIIASNTGDGINAISGSNNNTFIANSIFTNDGLGIDLADDGVNENDLNDIDEGANQIQNFPVITSALSSATQTFLAGTLQSTANTTFDLHFYTNAVADPSGNGEGETYLGTTQVTTDGSGNASFNFAAAGSNTGLFITATATHPTNGTSEFSDAVVVNAAPTVQFATATDSVAENAGTITITVTRSGDLSASSTVDYATSDGTATQPGDYTTASGTLTFAPTEASKTFNVTIADDSTHEPGEDFTITLTNPTTATLGAPATMTVTINDDDAVPSILIDDVSHNEGNGGTTSYTFTVSLSNATTSTVTVDYAAANDTATQPADYAAAAGTLTFNPGVTSQQLTVLVNGDTTFEPDETFFVNLTNASNATVSDPQGLGTIVNDDAQPQILIDDVSHNEGNGGTTSYTFTVTLTNPSASTVTVDYATADNTATQPSDYTSANNTLTFNPGVTSQQFTVLVNGDTTLEPDESFFVNLTNATNATISDTQGVGTITNDDATPSVLIDDVSHNEGNGGTTSYTFTVTLSNPSASTITVDYATADNTATQPSDYTSANNTLTFNPGVTSQTFTVFVNGDTTNEGNETFFVNLSNATNATIGDAQGLGTIVNDDGAPQISINDVPLNEGDSGTTPFSFTVSLSNPSDAAITVDYVTANGTATAGSDYTGASGTVTFNPGVTTQNVVVNVSGDTTTEANETFFVNLLNPTNATILDNQGLGTITNDDQPPVIAINDVTLAEGNSGTTPFTFDVTLSHASAFPVTVDYMPSGGVFTASAGSDYTPASGTLTFAPGVTTQQITVNVTGDTSNEPDETFGVALSNPANATIGDALGTGTITNDDPAGTISITDLSLPEGDSGATVYSFNVTLSNPMEAVVTVNWATADGTATAGSDYTAASGTVTFLANQTSQNVIVNVNGDTTTEPDETFFVNLTNPTNAAIADGQGLGTILNDDTPPSITIDSPTLNEGDAGTTPFTFTVALSHASASTITVDYATANGTASSGSDYASASGTLTFNPGTLAQSVVVNVNGDTTPELNETFTVNLTNATGATIALAQGTGTITNDDVSPASADLSITKTTNATTFTSGQQLTYTITVANNGTDAATNVVVTDTLPAGTTFVSATPSAGSCSGTTTVTCSLGTLAANTSATITLVITAGGSTAIVNTATVAAVENDPNPANNSVSAAPVAPAPVANVETIPTLGEWSLLAFAAMLAAVAVLTRLRS